MIDNKMCGNFTLRLHYVSGRVSATGVVFAHIFWLQLNQETNVTSLIYLLLFFKGPYAEKEAKLI